MSGLGLSNMSIVAFIVNLLIMVLVLGGIIALAIWFVTRLTKNGDTSPKQNPIDIVRLRYAKGEITKEQFEQIKKDLY